MSYLFTLLIKNTFAQNFSKLKFFRTIGSAFFLSLLLAIGMVFGEAEPIRAGNSVLCGSEQSNPVLEIQHPGFHFSLAIEGNNFLQIFSQLHRLPNCTVPAEKVVPANFLFTTIICVPLLIDFNYPVPLFTRGHVLRH